MNDYLDVPEVFRLKVLEACAHLPEVHEHQSHAGFMVRIRTNTIVHVVTRDREPEPVTTMTFHCRGMEAEALIASGDPFYEGWGGGLVAMVLRDNTDWTEAKELLTDSYCYLAPRKLIALLDLG